MFVTIQARQIKPSSNVARADDNILFTLKPQITFLLQKDTSKKLVSDTLAILCFACMWCNVVTDASKMILNKPRNRQQCICQLRSFLRVSSSVIICRLSNKSTGCVSYRIIINFTLHFITQDSSKTARLRPS